MLDDSTFLTSPPETWRPRPEWLARPDGLMGQIEGRGDRVAVVSGERSWAYGELHDEVQGFAGYLRSCGLSAGQGVAVYAPNCFEWIVVQLAVALVGGVVVPVNVRARAGELADLLMETRPRVVVMAADFMTNPMAQRMADALEEVNGRLGDGAEIVKRIVFVGDDVGVEELGGIKITPWHDAVRKGEPEAGGRIASTTGDHVPFLAMWTSGTTSVPRGVVHTWLGIMSSLWDWSTTFGYSETDTIVVTRPFYYISGNMFSMLGSIVHGAELVLVPTLNPAELLGAIRRHGGTAIMGGPHLYRQLLEVADTHGPPTTLERVASGGDYLSPELVEDLHGRLGVKTVMQSYGMTELRGFVTVTLPTDPADSVAKNVGVCLPGVQLMILGENGEECPKGEVGEIHVKGRSPWGHFENGRLVPAEAGWHATGDLGWEEGERLRLAGRMSGIVKVSGERVHLDDVESFVRRLDGIGQVAAVPLPDPDRGEVVGLVLELVDATADPERAAHALLAKLREQLAPAKCPRVAAIVPPDWDWPRTLTGKLVRRKILDRLMDHMSDDKDEVMRSVVDIRQSMDGRHAEVGKP